MSNGDERRQAAIQRLGEKRSFSSHIVTYIVINAMLILLWAVSGAGYFWPIWPLLGWGAGLAVHAWSLFGQQPITEDDINREIQRGV